MKSTFNKNRGFSLMELLIAIAILSIIMVAIGSFLTTTLHTQSRTSKEIEVQDEAQRIYYQMADILMQATYVRVQPVDGNAYEYDTTDKKMGTTATNLFADAVGVDTDKIAYISENYPNYQLTGTSNVTPRKIIVDYTNGYLYNEKDIKYPEAGAEIDERDATASYTLKSFRRLNETVSGTQHKYYVIPKYIYVEYSNEDTLIDSTERVTQKIYKKKYSNSNATTEISTEVEVVTKSTPKTNYVIFKFDQSSGSLYMYRFDGSATVPDRDHCFEKAVAAIDGKKYDAAKKQLPVEGLVSSNVKEMYISADPDENSFDIDLNIESTRYAGHRYEMLQTVNFRNNNVLTTKPQLLLKWKGKTSTPAPGTP